MNCAGRNMGRHLKKLVNDKKINECWNKTLGYDVGTTSAFVHSTTMSLYMLWTDAIHDRDNLVGKLRRQTKDETRQKEKFWSLNDSKNLYFQSRCIEKHFSILDRVNIECDKCNQKFINKDALNLHMESIHNAINEYFDCVKCNFDGSYLMVLEHVKVFMNKV